MIKAILLFAICAGLTFTAIGANSDALPSGVSGTIAYTLDQNPRGHSTLDTTGEVLRTFPVPVQSPTDLGVSVAVDCNGNLFYTNYLVAEVYKISAEGDLLQTLPLHTGDGASVNIDQMVWDQNRGLFWGVEDATFRIFLIDPTTGLCTFQFTGLVQNAPIRVSDGLAIDPSDGTIWHSPDVSDSIGHFTTSGVYLGSLTPLGPTGSPDRDISGIVVGTGNRMFVGHDGQGRVSVVNKITGQWIQDLVTLPERVQGMSCDPVNFAPDFAIWIKNGLNNTLSAIQVDSGACACTAQQDTCQFPFTQVDMGDLPACGYPTLVNNPAHGLSGIAWLGNCVTGETAPHAAGGDSCNDGVIFLNMPWMPCTNQSLTVTVTAGPNYDRFAGCGGHLYLNAWKDGNLNGTFCDELACAGGTVASEWIIQDRQVTPGSRTITVLDPGVLDMGIYAGVFRVRLTSQPVGRYGFGAVSAACPGMTCGSYGLDVLGEVEDYDIPDFQLAVFLNSFTAQAGDETIALRWVTASENANDHFEILRDGHNIARVSSQGDGATARTYRYSDDGLMNGTVYSYSLVAVDINGHRTELGTVTAAPRVGQGAVSDYALRQNYPNPFNPSTEISFDLEAAGFVSLKIFNLLGEEVATVIRADMSQGRHQAAFDASSLPSGIYLYRLRVNGFTAEKKMLLMK
jgi:hypothetical protein